MYTSFKSSTSVFTDATLHLLHHPLVRHLLSNLRYNGGEGAIERRDANLLSAQELPIWTIRDSSLPQHSLQLVGHGHGLSLHVYFQVLQRTASEHNLNSPSHL